MRQLLASVLHFLDRAVAHFQAGTVHRAVEALEDRLAFLGAVFGFFGRRTAGRWRGDSFCRLGRWLAGSFTAESHLEDFQLLQELRSVWTVEV